MHISCVYIYIYICRERERERERVCMYPRILEADGGVESVRAAHAAWRLAPAARASKQADFGWHYVSNATCLMRPRLFHVCFVSSNASRRQRARRPPRPPESPPSPRPGPARAPDVNKHVSIDKHININNKVGVPMSLGIPTLEINSLSESNPLKSRASVRKLAVPPAAFPEPARAPGPGPRPHAGADVCCCRCICRAGEIQLESYCFGQVWCCSRFQWKFMFVQQISFQVVYAYVHLSCMCVV